MLQLKFRLFTRVLRLSISISPRILVGYFATVANLGTPTEIYGIGQRIEEIQWKGTIMLTPGGYKGVFRRDMMERTSPYVICS
jgi:hypothetical protein